MEGSLLLRQGWFESYGPDKMQVFAVETRSCAGGNSALSPLSDSAASGYCHRQCRSLGALDVWLVIHAGWKSEASPQTVFQISLLRQMDGKAELG